MEASKKLLRFLWTPERLAKRANTRPIFAIPPVKAAFESAVYQGDPLVKRFNPEIRMLFNDVMPYEYRHGLEAGLSPLAGQMKFLHFRRCGSECDLAQLDSGAGCGLAGWAIAGYACLF